jgi:hypothetical protein
VAAGFTWSWSRYRTFDTCPRRFWLSVYAAPLAKRKGVGHPDFEVWVQRHLMGSAQWAGLAAHEAVEWTLKGAVEGRSVPRQGVMDRTLRQARRVLEMSTGGYFRGDPKTFRGFDAHYYDAEFDGQAALQTLQDKVEKLLDHPILARLLSVPERIQEVERLSRIRLWGFDIWLSPDVVVADGRGGFVVVDWKTGRNHASEVVDGQLGLYGVYVIDRILKVRADSGRRLPVDRVQGLMAGLGDPAFRTRPLTAEDVFAARDAMVGSAPKMRGDGVERNGEIPKKEGFPKIPLGSGPCSWCSFRRTCERE